MYKLVNAYCLGALKGDEDCMVKLIEVLEPLMEAMVSSMFPRTTEREDLLSEARCVMLECLGTYDASKGVQFVAYYRSQLRYRFYERIRSNVNQPIPVLDVVSESGVSGTDQLVSELTVEGVFVRRESMGVFEEAMGLLAPREREVIELFYFEGLGMSEISGFLGLSYQSVANTKSRGLRKLGEFLANEDLEGLYDD